MKKLGIVKILLVLVVIVMANLYSGCVHKHYYKEPESSQSQIENQEAQIAALQKEMEELK